MGELIIKPVASSGQCFRQQDAFSCDGPMEESPEMWQRCSLTQLTCKDPNVILLGFSDPLCRSEIRLNSINLPSGAAQCYTTPCSGKLMPYSLIRGYWEGFRHWWGLETRVPRQTLCGPIQQPQSCWISHHSICKHGKRGSCQPSPCSL